MVALCDFKCFWGMNRTCFMLLWARYSPAASSSALSPHIQRYLYFQLQYTVYNNISQNLILITSNGIWEIFG